MCKIVNILLNSTLTIPFAITVIFTSVINDLFMDANFTAWFRNEPAHLTFIDKLLAPIVFVALSITLHNTFATNIFQIICAASVSFPYFWVIARIHSLIYVGIWVWTKRAMSSKEITLSSFPVIDFNTVIYSDWFALIKAILHIVF